MNAYQGSYTKMYWIHSSWYYLKKFTFILYMPFKESYNSFDNHNSCTYIGYVHPNKCQLVSLVHIQELQFMPCISYRDSYYFLCCHKPCDCMVWFHVLHDQFCIIELYHLLTHGYVVMLHIKRESIYITWGIDHDLNLHTWIALMDRFCII